MLEIPFLTKLNAKVEPILDCSSSFLYDKGENIYIPLDGKLTTDQFTFLPNQAFTQMGLCQQQLYKLTKESHNQKVMIIKVLNIWPHLDLEIKEDLKYLSLITQNKLLSKYEALPTFLFQYLDRIIVMSKQVVKIDNSVVFVADGILFQNGRQVINYFEGEAMAITECRLYSLKKSKYKDIQQLTLFGECDVKLTLHSPELMLKSAVLQFESPKFPQNTVIKDMKAIKQLIKGEDYQQLRQKLNEVFGKKNTDQIQQISIKQLQQTNNSVRLRTSSYQEDSQPKKIFRRVYKAREIDRSQQQQPSLGEIRKINYTPLRNRQSRPKINNSQLRQKTIEQQQQQQQQQQQCLPIIKSFVSVEEYQQQQQQYTKKKGQYKKKIAQNKFIEFDKILNQLIK